MKITYLLGNGFDLNLRLKTSYRDFIKYYTEQSSDNVLIKNLKLNIVKDIEQWSDFEKKLGEYTMILKNIEEYVVIINDIRKNLQTFLINQTSNISFDKSSAESLKQDLMFPENYLLLDYKKEISKIKNAFSHIEISILTFNYTPILETINSASKFISEIVLFENRHYFFKQIEHIHGYIDKRMVLGVDNETQILNPNLKKGIKHLRNILKPNINSTYGISHHIDCMKIIDSSNLIILFGLSYGDTDNTWWNLILNRLLEDKNCMLVIFHYEPTFVDKDNDGPGRVAREEIIKDIFMNKLELDESTLLDLESRIIVDINSNIFSIPFEIYS